jgi:hypothetical protein
MRYAAAALVLALVALPLALQPNWLMGSVAALVGMLGGIGLIRPSVTMARVCGIMALIALTSALWLTSAPPNLAIGAGVGLALLHLLALAGLAGHFGGATVHPSAVRALILFWTTASAGMAGAILVLGMGAGVIVPLVPPGAARSVIAGAGGLVAFVAVVRVFLTQVDRFR